MNRIADFFERLSLPCVYKEYFGHDCPGCGIQSAFIELLKGNFIESFLLYPPLLFLLFLLSFFLVHLLFPVKNGDTIMQWAFRVTVVAIILNYILKIFM